MRLKKIILHNIRSYLEVEVDFPDGSLLLSGETGSGKSSILLGIEFALFGLGKGKDGISGDALLRRGKDEGFIQLFFDIDGMEIEIKRNLRRQAGKTQQLGGYIRINGKLEKLSPDEIRTRVLQLFNYPLEFIKKGKGLPFHYTVYTQQEQMKAILLEGADLRLDTLRRVFGIDRYKIIKENSEIFLSALREKVKQKEGAISDLPEKTDQFKFQQQEKEKNKSELEKIEPELKKAKQGLSKKRTEIEELEKKIEGARKTKERLSAKKAEIKGKQERIAREEEELNSLEEEIKQIEVEGKKFDEKELLTANEKLKKFGENIRKNEVEIRNLIRALSKAESKKDSASVLKEKIRKVEVCPECGQKVTEEHKKEIEEKASKEIISAESKIKEIQNLKKQQEEEKSEQEKEEEQLESIQQEQRELKIKAENLKEKFDRKKRLEQEKKILQEKVKESEKMAAELEVSLRKAADVEADYQKKRKEFETVREHEKELEIKKAGFEKMLENLSSQLELLDEEIKRKEKHKEDMLYLKDLREWLSGNFAEIIMKIEQSVLAALHSQFDSSLKKWFSMLIEEPEITVRLEPDFSPVVEQAGFDTEYSHLSGGERTAVALAYRLALNQVINSLISQIKTRDILILDEPTEGFSHLQLDKMRNVLRELNLKQLIIISHNPKIESFVDNVIKVRKEGHVSKISGQ